MATDKPIFSVTVAIVCYGDYSGLNRTISSILEQRCPIETIILSDDGSNKPFPAEALSLLHTASCPIITRQGEENLGTTAHLNLLAKSCTSDCIKFIGAGDAFSDPDALSELVSYLRETGALVATSNSVVSSCDLSCQYYVFPGARGKSLAEKQGPELFALLARSNIISAVGSLFHRQFFTDMNGFDETYRLLEDWPTWLRIARAGQKIAFLDRVTCLYALGGSSSKAGNAFYNPSLQKDLLLCYDREILPFSNSLPKKELREIEYGRLLLQGDKTFLLWRKYGSIHLKQLIKRRVKWLLLRVKPLIAKILSV